MPLQHRFSDLSLRTKILVAAVIVVGAVCLFAAVHFPLANAHRAEAEFQAKAELIARFGDAALIDAAASSGARARVAEITKRLAESPPLSSFAFALDSGATRVLAGELDLLGPDSLYLAGVLPASLPDVNALVLRRELERGGKKLGIAYYVFSRHELDAGIAEYEAAVVRATAGAFLGVLSLLFLVVSVVLRPVGQLAVIVEQAVRGETPSRAIVPFNDETGRLASGINTLFLNNEATVRHVATLTALVEKREAQLSAEADSRREVEKQVQLSNEIINKVSALILVANNTGGIVYASPSFEGVLGFKPEELQDDGWWRLSRASVEERVKERNLVAKFARRELRMSSQPYERRIHNAQGEPRWILWQDTLGFNNTVIGVGHDITERKHAEEQIREQAALLDITTDAILVRSLDHRILFWNRGAEKLYGIAAEEARSGTAEELLGDEGVSGVGLAYAGVIENGSWSGELKQTTRSGKKIVVESRWTLMNDEQGKPRSILVVNTDVTEQRQLEVQFRRAQRLENIGTLAGGIAHDLNNVLTPIIMATQALQNRLPDERSRHLLSTIGLSARRGADIVKQVLTFARGSEGERMLLQPKHILREVEQITRETFPKSLELSFDIPSRLWTICGDATQLHQIFLNLMVNARDAMPDGGQLTIKAENVVLSEEEARRHLHAKAGNYVVLSVTDTGTGIPPEVLDRIFDPFFTTKEVGKGTGLGLSTVMSIVKSYDGFIIVNTEVGKGTEFRIHFPSAHVDDAGASEETGRRKVPSGKGEWILVVDDEVSIREILKETLEAYGYRVLTAKDGLEALGMVDEERGKIRLVVTDLMMPTMDGASLTRTLSQMAPEIKIIVVSGMADQDLLERVRKSRIEALMLKPVQTDQLLGIIHGALTAREEAPHRM